MFKSIATLAAIGGTLGAPVVAETPKVANMLIDLGPAGVVFKHASYSKRVAKIASDILSDVGLQQGDVLRLATFGNPNILDHLDLSELNREIVFSYRGGNCPGCF